jgi:hypothetical protein
MIPIENHDPFSNKSEKLKKKQNFDEVLNQISSIHVALK